MHLSGIVETIGLLACILLVSTGTAIAKLSSATGGTESVDFGLFRVDASYNETKYDNRLRLSKFYLKGAINSNYLPFDHPIAAIKMTRVEDLIPCDNLTLFEKDQEQLVDCQPLDSQISDKAKVTTNSNAAGKYVRMHSIRNKATHLFDSNSNSQVEYQLYPLRQDVTETNLESVTAFYNIQNPTKSNVNRGYYIQAKRPRTTSSVVCSGNLYFSVNETEAFELSEDGYPEFLDRISHLINQAYENGFILSLPNFSCSSPETTSLLAMNFNFTVAHSNEFPFLFLRQDIKFTPNTQLLNYKSAIDQSGDQYSYNTTISIESSSTAIPLANFNLHQTFVNHDLKSGFERMRLIYPALSVLVDADWSLSDFSKSLKLILNDSPAKDMIPQSADEMKAVLNLLYSDSQIEDHITTALKINRNLVRLFKSQLESLVDIYYPSSAGMGREESGGKRREEL